MVVVNDAELLLPLMSQERRKTSAGETLQENVHCSSKVPYSLAMFLSWPLLGAGIVGDPKRPQIYLHRDGLRPLHPSQIDPSQIVELARVENAAKRPT
jgi:hypothetical protein